VRPNCAQNGLGGSGRRGSEVAGEVGDDGRPVVEHLVRRELDPPQPDGDQFPVPLRIGASVFAGRVGAMPADLHDEALFRIEEVEPAQSTRWRSNGHLAERNRQACAPESTAEDPLEMAVQLPGSAVEHAPETANSPPAPCAEAVELAGQGERAGVPVAQGRIERGSQAVVGHPRVGGEVEDGSGGRGRGQAAPAGPVDWFEVTGPVDHRIGPPACSLAEGNDDLDHIGLAESIESEQVGGGPAGEEGVWTGVDECDPGSPFEAGGLAGHQERPARWRGDEPTLLTCGSELMAAQPRLASTKDAVLTAGRGRVSR